MRKPANGVCIVCGELRNRNTSKYCSLKHQYEFQQKDRIIRWKNGLISGVIGKTSSTAIFIKQYIREKYNNKCSICGWGETHPITKRVPLEVDHIDGNAENNKEENLRLICPNCHALTANFRNLNKGKGRKGR